ncbi:cryptochrome/photolyase family protein [Marimonas lutisalis]|uniref:cryptochrome/photolyase family protein n=1 Tax=Marimonas lutisalis TaxID=2545756 RepID=UPI0010F820A7|nr:deoxyribodipyrimidine photo-lyase [Marimonas lutisalis]
MSGKAVQIWWLRRDLRLGDNPALNAALEAGPVIPVFIHDVHVDELGAAPKWRLEQGLRALAQRLEGMGSRLILRRGPALDVLRELVAETGAKAVHWNRLYDPLSRERDADIKRELKDEGIEATSHAAHVLFEPWTVETGTGGFYKVFSPFWKAVRGRDPGAPLAPPGKIAAPEVWPASDALADWALGRAMNRGAEVLARHCKPGEEAAEVRLHEFVEEGLADYKARRDMPGMDGTSRLSEYLALGEISPRRVWAVGMQAREAGNAGAEPFLREVGWRDFAHHLMYHTPHLLSDNWREGWDGFPWSEDAESDAVMAWKQGRTGIDFVDAAMREMYVTGHMHNRARMVVASYLTKHMLVHWKVGQAWFAECLTDWDPASNAMGWQWTAGCGPDAAPYFRVFNPDTQLEKFDPKGDYAKAWLAEGQRTPSETALSFFEAMPRSWNLSPEDRRPEPIVGLKAGRERALAAYESVR